MGSRLLASDVGLRATDRTRALALPAHGSAMGQAEQDESSLPLNGLRS